MAASAIISPINDPFDVGCEFISKIYHSSNKFRLLDPRLNYRFDFMLRKLPGIYFQPMNMLYVKCSRQLNHKIQKSAHCWLIKCFRFQQIKPINRKQKKPIMHKRWKIQLLIDGQTEVVHTGSWNFNDLMRYLKLRIIDLFQSHCLMPSIKKFTWQMSSICSFFVQQWFISKKTSSSGNIKIRHFPYLLNNGKFNGSDPNSIKHNVDSVNQIELNSHGMMT